jgi:hypothetical protein
MTGRHRTLFKNVALASLLSLLSLAFAACGGNSGESASAGTPAAGEQVKLADFPKTDGKITLNQLQKSVNAKQNGNLLPAANNFVRGRENRLPFGLFLEDRTPLWGPTVIYYATGTDQPAVGPIAAPAHGFAIPQQYRSTTTAADSESVGNGFYAATIPAARGAKKLGVMALTKTEDGYEASAIALPLKTTDPTIAVGERVPAIDTPTATTPEELEKIDTRDPHDSMHRVSLKDALKARQPVVLVFATPKLCASRVCAPVTDIAEWVHQEYGSGVTFIHNEIYRDNDLNKGYRPQVKAFNLPSEPYTFVIGTDGRVAEALQGPFDADELRAAIARVRPTN